MPEPQILPVRTSHELHALGEVLQGTFGAASPSDDWWNHFVTNAGRENLVHARLGDETLGGFGVYRVSQMFGGQAVAAGAIAAVGLRPEVRGTGLGTALMKHHLRHMHHEAVPLSVLFASTTSFYRRVGYELAGEFVVYALPPSALNMGERTLPTKRLRVDPEHPPQVLLDLYEQQARRSSGHLIRGPGFWRRALHTDTAPLHCVVLGDPAQGYLTWYHRADNQVLVRDAVALTDKACRRLFTILADLGTIERTVLWKGPAQDHRLHNLPTRASDLRVHQHDSWMLRIVRVAEAMAGRGYPRLLDGRTLHLDIEDPLFTENCGKWQISWDDGTATVRTGAADPAQTINLGVHALAPLYTGHVSATTLAFQGCLDGPDEAIALANAAFQGPRPWMPDIF